MTIRTRLTIRFTLLVGAISLAFSGAIYYLYAFYLSNEFYGRLQENAFNTAQSLTGVNGMNPAFLMEMDRNRLTSLFSEEATIYNPANGIIYDSGNEPFPVLQALLGQVRQGQWLRLWDGRVEAVAVPYRQAGTSSRASSKSPGCRPVPPLLTRKPSIRCWKQSGT